MTNLISSFKSQSTIYFNQLLEFSKEYQANGKLSDKSQAEYGQTIFDFYELTTAFITRTSSKTSLHDSLFNRMMVFQEIVYESIIRNNDISSGLKIYLDLQNRSMLKLIELDKVSDEDLIWDHAIMLIITMFQNLKLNK